MERVVALSTVETAVAYPFSTLQARRVVNDHFDGSPIVVFWVPGTASAVDAARIADGREVGSSGVFNRRLDTLLLTFESIGGGRFKDRETGSTWNILGWSEAGELAGTQLELVPHGNHFWFAWGVFRPDSRIVK
jgi:hypothetical protein